MKPPQEMIDAFYDQLAGGFVIPEEARAGIGAVLDLIEQRGFIAEVEGDEVRVIAARTYRIPELAAMLREGLPISFKAEVQWRAVPAERSAE